MVSKRADTLDRQRNAGRKTWAELRRASANLILLLFVHALLAPFAHADVRTDARRHFRRGMSLIQVGDYTEGLKELLEAYELLPHPAVLYNIARGAAEAGEYAMAVEYFRLYADTEPADREEVQAFVRALESRLQEQRVAAGLVTPARDGAAPAASDAPLARPVIAQVEPTQPQAGASSPASAPSVPTTASVTPAATTPPQIRAAREQNVYEEQVVSASRYAQSPLSAPSSTTTITAQDIRMSGLMPLGDLVRRAAGVDVMQLTPSDTQVSVRGFNQRLNNKLIWLIDGRSVNVDFIGATFVNLLPINTEDIERIEIIRGPASAVYGADAFTGVINIITKKPGSEEGGYVSAAGGNHDRIRSTASISNQFGKVGVRVSGGYEQIDRFAIDTPKTRVDLAQPVEDPSTDGRRQWVDLQGRVYIGEGWTAVAGTALTQAGPGVFLSQGLQRQSVALDSTFVQTHASVSSPQGVTLRAFWNHIDADIAQTAEPLGQYADRNRLNGDIVDEELTYNTAFHLLADHRVTVGASARQKTVRWNWLDQKRTQLHVAAFAQDTMTFTRWLDVHLSARVDRHPLLDLLFSPRGSLIAKPTEHQSFRLTGATAFRAPTFIESYLDTESGSGVPGITVLAKGNLNLSPERIVSAEVGYANQESDYVSLEVNAFYNIVTQQIQTNALSVSRLVDANPYNQDSQAFPIATQSSINEGLAWHSVGGEAGVRLYPFDGLDVYANYAYTRVTSRGPTSAVPGREQDDRTPDHKVNGGVQYRAPFGLELALDAHYVGKQRWAEDAVDPARGLVYRIHDLPAYTLLNGRVGYELVKNHLDLGINVLNILDARMRQHPFAQPGSRLGMVYAKLRW